MKENKNDIILWWSPQKRDTFYWNNYCIHGNFRLSIPQTISPRLEFAHADTVVLKR